MRQLLLVAAALVVSASPAFAQDPVTVDPKHYKVELENDQVRVLRITYGPGEKSAMHAHPASIAVFLTDAHAKFAQPDGTTQDVHSKAGSVEWGRAERHLPENVGDKRFELILVELKGKPVTTK